MLSSEFPRAHQLGNVGYVDKEKRLKKLSDDLVRPDEQNHFPLCPIADAIDIAKNDTEENDLPDEPEHLDNQPEQKICFETHLADERIAQHDSVNLDVTPHS